MKNTSSDSGLYSAFNMRYFIEVRYKGTRFSGFQIQENAVTVQSEIEKAYEVLHRQPVSLTGSSRTDAGVHALQNFFHFDAEEVHSQFVYKMNAILPPDVVVVSIYKMEPEAHCRFNALSRSYRYQTHRFKDPFRREVSLYLPYRLNLEAMQEAAQYVMTQQNFFAFSKTNTQVKTFECRISRSIWKEDGVGLVYEIEGNRFLRGMVRLLTATQIKIGRGQLSIEGFKKLFKEERKCGFSVPAHGLFLERVAFPQNYFPATGPGLDAF